MDPSYGAINRAIERRAQSDNVFRARLKGSGRPIVSAFRSYTDDELLAELSNLGIAMDRAIFERESRRALSAEELSKRLSAESRGDQSPWRLERIWIALTLLWERWTPERPSFEMVEDWMEEGYAVSTAGNPASASTLWLRAWSALMKAADERGFASIGELDAAFRGALRLAHWMEDFGVELESAGTHDPSFFRAGLQFWKEYLERFGDENPDLANQARADLGVFRAGLGEIETAERLFDEWLKADPQWGWGWIAWAYCYTADFSVARDYEKAAHLLEEGASVEGVRDELEILDRLEHTYSQHLHDVPAARRVLARMERLEQEGQDVRHSDHDHHHHHHHDHERRFTETDGSWWEKLFEKSPKVGRNEPCPCGSGLKFKKCCGR